MFNLTETDQKPVFSLGGSAAKEMTPAFVGDQAAKLHLALRDQSPGVGALSSALTLDGAEQYKRLLADQNAISRVEVRNDILSQIMSAGPEQINPEIVNVVQGLTDADLESENVGNVIERNYARLYTETAASNLGNDILEDARANDEETTFEYLDRTERAVFKKNFIATKAAEVQREIDSMSWADTAWNFTERLVPFLEWYQKQNAVGAESEMVSSLLPGSNLEEQFAYMWSISDPSAFSEKLETALSELNSRNPYVAQSWLQGLMSYGSSDKYIDNLFGMADVASGVAAPVKVLGRALRGVIKAGAKTPVKLYQHTKELGQFDNAAVGKIAEELTEGTYKSPDINDFKALEQSTPSIHNPDALMVGSQNVPQAVYLRMKEALQNNADLAKRFLTEPNLIDRANPEELLQYKDVLLRQYVKDNPSIQKNVIDVRIVGADLGNVYQAEVVIGKADGTLFESAEQAQTYFDRFIGGTKDYTVRQVGAGFEIAVKKTVDETKFLTDLTLPTMNKTPQNLGAIFGGWWRSPNYTVSRNQELARSTAVTSTERLRAIYEDLAEPFSRLSKDEVKELDELLSHNQHSAEFKNYGEFEQAFFLKFKKNPTTDQGITWATSRQLMDLDLMVRDLDWYKQKAIQGRERIQITDLDFEGKVLDDLPFGGPQFTYSVYKDGKFGPRKVSTYTNESEKTKLKELLAQGYKVVQVANQRLKIGEKAYVGFVVTKDLKRSRVGVQNIQRRAGGHKVDTYKGYIKQGVFNEGSDRTFYNSDTTLFGIRTEQEGREYVKLLEEARQMALRKDPGTLKFVRDKLGIDTKRWAAAVKDGLIDLNREFVYTPKGFRTIDTGAYKNLPNVEAGVSPYNLDAKLMGRYGSERDASSIDVITSESDIAFEVKGADYLSPIDTLRMSGRNVITTRMMHDYTLMTHRDFVREFGDILDGTKEELMTSGVSTLTDPKFLPGANPERVAAAKNVSRAYRNLLNQGTYIDNLIDVQKDKIVTSVMRKMGPRGAEWVSDRLIPMVKDPAVAMRSFAFHTKMGFFNINQMFVQAQSMVNVVSVGGINGMKSGAAFPLYRLALLNSNPEVIKAIAKKAQLLGLMKADEFEESLRLYKKSGFNQIGKDTAYLDDARGPEIRKGVTKSILDWGTKPFNEGERFVRQAAFNTAYLEEKALLKGKVIDRRSEARILQRAKDLTANMTRESNAEWQKGYLGIATQFMGYQARILEQFVGKKLTAAEKIRLFTGYSAMYGLPVAAGATMGVVPVREILLDNFAEQGIDVEGSIYEPFIDGFTSTIYEFITGDELNFASRYGPGGLPTIYDFLREDSSWTDVFLGASGSIAIDTFSPMFKRMASEFMDFEGGAYNLQERDFLAPLRNISTVDNAVKLYQVYNTGIWASKNGTNLVEMDLPDAVIAALTGLTPESISESFRKTEAMKEWKEEKRIFMNEATKAYSNIMKMEDSPTREKMIRELKAKMTMYGLDHTERGQVWIRAYNKEMFVDSVTDRYLDKKTERK